MWPGEQKYVETKLTVSVVIIAPRYNATKKQVEGLLIKERNSYNPSQPTVKFPSGSMTIEDKDIEAAVIREFRMETGYEARDITFCFAAEYTSTVPGERHVKAFFVAKGHEQVGLPTEKDILDTFWHPFQDIGTSMKIVAAQRLAMEPISCKVMSISGEIMLALMNQGSFSRPMEGDDF